MPRNLTRMSPEERDRYREYLRVKKQESRLRKRAAGLCIVQDADCEGKAKPGGSTCHSCDVRANNREKQAGWIPRPSRIIAQTVRRLRRQGLKVNDILKDDYLVEKGVKRDRVTQILRESNLLV